MKNWRARLLKHFGAFTLAGLMIVGWAACNQDNNASDGGTIDDFYIEKECAHGIDSSQSIETAFDLAEGSSKDEYICPSNDRDYYKVEVPQGKALLRIKMQHTAPTTPVKLTYRLLKREGTNDVAVGTAPDIKNNIFNAPHCLDPGTYYLLVEDDGNDRSDGENTYSLSYTTEPDKDTNEPNETKETATPASGSLTGYISCTGDKDWYKITATADQLIGIKLTTDNTSAVDLQYTLYHDDGSELKRLAAEDVADGSREKVDIDRVYHPPTGGTFYLVVEDREGNDSDVSLPYNLVVNVSAEPDANDKGGRNDHPNAATVMGSVSGTESCSNPKVFTQKGRIASLADTDYFRINAPATLTTPMVMEINVAFGGQTIVDPSVSLVLAHADSPCTSDKCCRVLSGDAGECANSLRCDGTSFSCIERGSVYCQECVKDAPIGCDQRKACAGAVVCLPTKTCGYQRFWRSTNNGATLKTAQPVSAGGPWFIRLSDERSDEWDGNAEYTLTVKVCADPDGAREPDNNYYPRLRAQPQKAPEPDNLELSDMAIVSYLTQGQQRAKPFAVTIPSDGSWSNHVTGYISYEHDDDNVTFDNPCAPDKCLLEAEVSTEGGGCPGAKKGPGLEFIFTLNKGGDFDGFPGAGTTSNNFNWGDDGSAGKCSMLVRSGGGFKMNIGDLFHNNYSWTCKYRVRFRVHQKSAACPAPCKTTAGTCHT